MPIQVAADTWWILRVPTNAPLLRLGDFPWHTDRGTKSPCRDNEWGCSVATVQTTTQPRQRQLWVSH